MGGRKDALAKYLQQDVGLSKPAQADAIAEFVKQTISSNADAAPRTSGSPRGGQITLCVEGNISAGKSTFLADIIQGSETLKVRGAYIHQLCLFLSSSSRVIYLCSPTEMTS
jgi:hypothetical protein